MFSDGAGGIGAGGAGACTGVGIGTGVGAGACTGAGIGAGAGAGEGVGICPGIVGTGIGVVLFIGRVAGEFCLADVGILASAADVAEAVDLFGGTGGNTFVSFLGGRLVALPAAPEIMAGRGEFLGSFLGSVFGLGVGATSGETVRSKPIPILGKGATGLLSCFPGRLGPWKALAEGCDTDAPTDGDALVSFGDSKDSKSTSMGAGGATAFCSG